MVAYLFDTKVALDPKTGELVRQGSLQVFAPEDTGATTPLAITDPTGLSMPTVETTSQALTEPFIVQDHPYVVLRAGSYAIPIDSPQGIIDRAEDAATSAALSQASALAAQAAAEAARAETAAAVKTVNGTPPDASGNVNVTGGGPGGGSVSTVNSKGPDGNGNVTLVPGDIGAAGASHTHAASATTTGVFAPARLGTGGTGGTTKFLREDGTFSTPPTGGGGGTGSVDSVNSVGPDGSGNVALSKTDLGLGAVDNTADAAKPVSTLQAAAIAGKANDSAVVKLTGNQAIAGVKTFSSPPVVPDSSFTMAKVAGLAAALNGLVTSNISGLQFVKVTVAEYNALPTPRPSNVVYIKVG